MSSLAHQMNYELESFFPLDLRTVSRMEIRNFFACFPHTTSRPSECVKMCEEHILSFLPGLREKGTSGILSAAHALPKALQPVVNT